MSNPKKKGTGVKLWSVLTVVMVILLIASIIGTNIALGASQAINIFLKTATYKVVETGDGTEDTEYFNVLVKQLGPSPKYWTIYPI